MPNLTTVGDLMDSVTTSVMEQVENSKLSIGTIVALSCVVLLG